MWKTERTGLSRCRIRTNHSSFHLTLLLISSPSTASSASWIFRFIALVCYQNNESIIEFTYNPSAILVPRAVNFSGEAWGTPEANFSRDKNTNSGILLLAGYHRFGSDCRRPCSVNKNMVKLLLQHLLFARIIIFHGGKLMGDRCHTRVRRRAKSQDPYCQVSSF